MAPFRSEDAAAARTCCAPREADVYLRTVFLLQRGKTVPEELVKPEELSKYRQVASHVVSAVMRAGAQKLPPVAGRLGLSCAASQRL